MTNEDVRQIRAEYKVVQGNSRKATNVIELATRYGISQQMVRDIAKRKRYGDVK
jgi:transposase